jgi:hypothetical protein
LVNGKISIDLCEMVASMRNLDPEELRAAAQQKLDGVAEPSLLSAQSEEDFRHSEYDALKNERGGAQTDLLVERAVLKEYQTSIASFFSHLALVHKLRETRVLAGFTRILPPDGNLKSERLRELKLDKRIDWLPAIVVRGEGIFFEFNPDFLNAWVKETKFVNDRVNSLNAHYNERRIKQGQEERPIRAKFVLMHTFAHVLINQLAFECGYGSASLRERIYCDFSNSSQPMSGVLIYTASGDSEGSMGGLVRQGHHGTFENIIMRALQHAAWCSSDPVCIESNGQGADNTNLAACHGCCLVPETSCEEGNRLLDRALLVGTPTHPEVGFFRTLVGL